MSNNWSIILPEATINLCTNQWTADAPDAVSSSSEQAKHGAYSHKFLAEGFSSPTGRVRMALTLEASSTYTISGWIYSPTPWEWGYIRFNALNYSGATITQVHQYTDAGSESDEWVYIEMKLDTASDVVGDIVIEAQSPDNGSVFYFDMVQVEKKAYPTTFCDGDMGEGYRWLGVPGASASERDQWAATGGLVANLSEFDFITGLDENTGVFPVEMLSAPMPLLPGDYVQGIKVLSRPNLILHGGFEGDDTADFHARRQALAKALNSRVGRIGAKPQPRQLIYHGAGVEKQIGVHLVAGLGVQDRIGTVGERIDGLQFYAPDPNWYGRDLQGAALTTQATATARYVARRLNKGGWDVMGPPSASGTYTGVYAVALYGNYVYFGGDFQNFDNIAAADRIVRYDKLTGTYAAVGSAGANAVITALAVDVQGRLYAAGPFTSIGGVSATGIALWDGSTWSALSTGISGGSGTVYSLAIGPDGALYAAGDFTTAGGVTVNNIAKWNGTTWSVMGTGGLNSYARAVIFSPDGYLYAAGDFTTAGGVSALQIARWNGTTWTALGSGISGGDVWALAAAPDGTLYAGGQFSSAGGTPASRVARWNGSSWAALGSGVDSDVYVLVVHRGQLIAAGAFTQAGTLSNVQRIARWNGSSWARLDAIFPGTPDIRAVAVDGEGDLYLGFTTTGTFIYSALTTINYVGTEKAYPVAQIVNTLPASVTVRVISIRNETTGAELLSDYVMQRGETLTIDLRPGNTAVISSFYGPKASAILPSDVADFYLTPGNGAGAQANVISCFIDGSSFGAYPGASLAWRDTYFSYD